MLQVLPYVPSFGEKLATAATGALSNIGHGFAERRTNQRDQEIINSFNPASSPLEQFQKFAMLSPRSQASLTPAFQQYLKGSSQQSAINQAAEAKRLEQEGLKESQISNFNRLEELKPNVGKTLQTITGINKLFPTEEAEIRKEVDSLGFLVADEAFTRLNKGTLYKEKFKYILEDLAPKASDNERVYQGKINALKRINGLSVDASIDQINKIAQEEKKRLGALEKGSKEKQERPPLSSFGS